MAPKIYDLTPILSKDLAVFPGDKAFTREVALSFEQGHHLELSSISTTAHLGAHADAPSHYHRDGASIENRSLDPYIGKAQVVRISGLKPKERVLPRHITTPLQAERVLIDTQSFQTPQKWDSNFNSLSPELLDFLAEKGVRLVGIDTPSVDPEDSKKLESHQALFQHDFSVLEGLLLKNVPEGVYTLIALPLPIKNGDASPVRAVLLPYPYTVT